MLARDAAAWERIWGHRLASLPPGDPSLPLVEGWWLRELGQLGRLGRVLEIGAGAAALVARLVVQHFPGTPVIASDFRTLPNTLDPRIERADNARIEALPFPDRHVDVLAAQFAFEYAQRDAAVAEVARVLRPGGVGRLLLHHPGSAYAKRLVHRLRTLQAATALGKLLIEPQLPPTARQPKLRQAQAKLRELRRAQLQGAAIAEVLADLDDFIAIAERASASKDGLPTPADLELLADCGPALQLTQQQMHAAVTSDALQALEKQFHAAGCTTSHDLLLNARQQPLAWILRLHRAA